MSVDMTTADTLPAVCQRCRPYIREDGWELDRLCLDCVTEVERLMEDQYGDYPSMREMLAMEDQWRKHDLEHRSH